MEFALWYVFFLHLSTMLFVVCFWLICTCWLVLYLLDMSNVMGFWTIETLDVCELGLVVNRNRDPDYIAPDFSQGIYEYNNGTYIFSFRALYCLTCMTW